MLRFRRSIPLAALLLLSGSPPLPAQSAPPQSGEPAYLRPGDVIALKIWREDDLTGEFPIAADGTVVLPKIGVWQATGVAPDSLEADILEAFRQYLRNPSIQVVFLRRINILGSVRQPGLYPVDPTLAVADALALAGGVTPDGKAGDVELRRNGEVLKADITENTKIGELQVLSGDQLFVPERSWISRNTGLVAVIISTLTTVALTIVNYNLSH